LAVSTAKLAAAALTAAGFGLAKTGDNNALMTQMYRGCAVASGLHAFSWRLKQKSTAGRCFFYQMKLFREVLF
jgi:hypothetical protein